MAFNLVNELSELDKVKLNNYIHLYGTREGFVGVDNWLNDWGKNKIKLYKLLGNKFEHRVDFSYDKSKEDLRHQLQELFRKHNYFYEELLDWAREHKLFDDRAVQSFIYDCFNVQTLLKDELFYGGFKFKLENQRKTLQIQKGAKPVRALGRFLTYCKDLEGADSLLCEFEAFRLDHSVVLNDKQIKGTLVFSINPIDFVTMSDNNSNWSSCMSWINSGCYHVGTVEMMNSNNVICCYLENKDPFYFGKGLLKENSEEYECGNKKWRQLIYITKDIIVGGKSYPYSNDDLSKKVIEITRELAKENLGWTYSFGVERYQDMKWINGAYSMDRAKGYIKYGKATKHNILFDSKGMYNDMLNDSDFHYWCVRNKVNHTKVISYSGKAPCLCCGDSALYKNDYVEDYNDRYCDTGEVICDSCLDAFRCDFCRSRDPLVKHIRVKLSSTGEEVSLCEHCVDRYIKKCPECGEPFFPLGGRERFDGLEHHNAFIRTMAEVEATLEDEIDDFHWYNIMLEDKDSFFNNCPDGLIPICKCNNCLEKDSRFKRIGPCTLRKTYWDVREYTYYISKEVQSSEDEWQNTLAYNLKKAELKDGDELHG